jgi:hypothetical protein
MFRPAEPPSEPPEEAAAFNAALRQPAKERADAKKEALDACSAEHLELLHCYKRGSLTLCAESRAAFWACYKKRRVRGGVLARVRWRDASRSACVLTPRDALCARAARLCVALRCATARTQCGRDAGALRNAHARIAHADVRTSRSPLRALRRRWWTRC